jgi:hypothetical protein
MMRSAELVTPRSDDGAAEPSTRTRIGTEHLLLACHGDADWPVSQPLARMGATGECPVELERSPFVEGAAAAGESVEDLLGALVPGEGGRRCNGKKRRDARADRRKRRTRG